MTRAATIPLVRRFPALAQVPRAEIGRFPTPVQSLPELSPRLWIKRDDRCGHPMGGNKVRALEFLLGGLEEKERIVTVGSAGSTHALAVVTYGKRIGATVGVGRWRQEMNPSAERVSQRIARDVRRDPAPTFRSPVGAYAWALRERLRGAKWIAAGGSAPLGVLGHVNAGLELVEQIDADELPQPKYVVVPLGTGGTMAGLALAFAIAKRDITVIGARVVPRLVGRRARVLRLARRTAALIERWTSERLPRVRPSSLQIVHDVYGGAYGRETAAAHAAGERLHTASNIELDATYSAKAFVLALALAAREPTLFWLTFDSRILAAP
jgi:1-aminocyclopropane-1-carboxylate deaminase/D-cysteine desulfhydrase-like pyridoxal-dependent ACC family enzyme